MFLIFRLQNVTVGKPRHFNSGAPVRAHTRHNYVTTTTTISRWERTFSEALAPTPPEHFFAFERLFPTRASDPPVPSLASRAHVARDRLAAYLLLDPLR